MSEDLNRYTGGCSDLEIPGATVGSCLATLCNRYPQLLVYFYEGMGREDACTTFSLNGEYLYEDGWPTTQVTETDQLYIADELPYGEHKWWRKVYQAADRIAHSVGHAINYINPYYYMVGANVRRYRHALRDARNAGRYNEIEDSATYSFDGAENTTASGTAIQIVYGEHRVAGQILNMYTEALPTQIVTNGAIYQENTLMAQVGLCEGEIESVDQVQVNKIPAALYSKVTTAPDPEWWRAGTNEQAVMPSFLFSESSVPVMQKVIVTSPPLPEIPVATTFVPVNGVVYTGTQNAMIGNYRVVYTEE